jgi:hypothetical protein
MPSLLPLIQKEGDRWENITIAHTPVVRSRQAGVVVERNKQAAVVERHIPLPGRVRYQRQPQHRTKQVQRLRQNGPHLLEC